MPAVRKGKDRIFETSVTVGAGSYALDGAQVGFQAFSAWSAANYGFYFATDDVNWEVGIGTWTAGPSTLARTKILDSSNGGAAVNWGAGTKKIHNSLPAGFAFPSVATKAVGGAVDVALAVEEQPCDVIILTGVLTGNISVTRDATPWKGTVYNNTTGAFTLTHKVLGQTGVVILQGKRKQLYCEGTDVFDGATDMAASGGGSLVLIQRQVAAAVASVDFATGIDDTYDEYVLKITDLIPATDNTDLWLRVSEDAGGSFKAGAADYNHENFGFTDAPASSAVGVSGDTKMLMRQGLGNTAATDSFRGELMFSRPGGAVRHKFFSWLLTCFRGGTATQVGGGKYKGTANAINGIRFLMSSGNITSGNFALYGVKKS